MLLGSEKFDLDVSVPLVLEYEDAAKRLLGEIPLTIKDIDDVIDYICSVATGRAISYLWRPLLQDSKDDMVLELAVAGRCHYIVTYNRRDFVGVDRFGLEVLTPKEFLEKIEA